MSNIQIIGQCSLCGGNVVVPQVWYGINPPTPTCQSCGAIKKSDLPVIDMVPWKPFIQRDNVRYVSPYQNEYDCKVVITRWTPEH